VSGQLINILVASKIVGENANHSFHFPKHTAKNHYQKLAVAAISSEWWGDKGLGVEPPAGSRGRAPGQGVMGRSPPEAEKKLTFTFASPNQNVGGTCPPVPPIIAAHEN